MTSSHPTPPLPPPPHPAQAARSLAEAALSAAGAWAQPLDPARHSRAVSQLHSALRDIGIATRGLTHWKPTEALPESASAEFARHVTAGARWLLTAWSCLDDILASEGLAQLPDPDEPGAALCRVARLTILAWRQPSGSSLDRDTAIRQLITAIGFLSAATVSLATYAPHHSAIDLQTLGASLTAVIADLTAALETDNGTAPEAKQGPARHQPGGLE